MYRRAALNRLALVRSSCVIAIAAKPKAIRAHSNL